ncbi:hypothetical protein D1AOALGA4SA_60 [Olavius algarvensis Delta 1 endosymbiont]|nr:hypothetical protein D1AOALGA4SA_60 [Olavius algarvensis Delta 1 endosymbiont]
MLPGLSLAPTTAIDFGRKILSKEWTHKRKNSHYISMIR